MLRVQVLATVVALTAVFVLGETRKYQKSGFMPGEFCFFTHGQCRDFFVNLGYLMILPHQKH